MWKELIWFWFKDKTHGRSWCGHTTILLIDITNKGYFGTELSMSLVQWHLSSVGHACLIFPRLERKAAKTRWKAMITFIVSPCLDRYFIISILKCLHCFQWVNHWVNQSNMVVQNEKLEQSQSNRLKRPGSIKQGQSNRFFRQEHWQINGKASKVNISS